MPEQPARDRFVSTAARLFAERGYAATSVADIQTALGMRAGSGALYKHFASKQDLLEAVVEVHLVTMRTGRSDFAADVPADLEAALRYLADAMWRALRHDRDILRVLLRDLDDFPALRDRMWKVIRADIYDVFTAWLQAQAAGGVIRVSDPRATAAVLLASLTYAPILEALIGHRPGDVRAAQFKQAWVESALATLGVR